MSRRFSRIATLAIAFACITFLSGCMMVQSPVMGLWMDGVGAPVDAGDRVGTKEGRACATSYAGFYATGNASIKAAAEAGDITRIDSVDAEISSMIVIGTYCTIVRGS